MITTLNLFSGIGGITLSLEHIGTFETTAFCENEKQVVKWEWLR